RGRPLRQPHPPAGGRGGGARPAEPPPPPADPPPVGGQGCDAEPPRRVPARALPLRRRARAARARARADHRAPGGTVLLLRGAPREPGRPDAGRGPFHPVVALPRRRPREPGRRARALQRAEERLPRRGGACRSLALPDALRIAPVSSVWPKRPAGHVIPIGRSAWRGRSTSACRRTRASGCGARSSSLLIVRRSKRRWTRRRHERFVATAALLTPLT